MNPRPAPEPQLLPAGRIHPGVPRSETAGTFLQSVLHGADPARTRRGFSYALNGAVRTLVLQPAETAGEDAELSAAVRGSGPQPYDVDLVCECLDEDEWSVLRGFVTMNATALGSLSPDDFVMTLDEAATERDICLFPGPDDVDLWCTCPDDGDPCKHGAALAYAFAQALDDDPFMLLLLRGHDRQALKRRTAPDDRHLPDIPAPAAAAGSVPAAAAFTEAVAPLPGLPQPADHLLFAPTVLPGREPDPDALFLLGTDTARRASSLLNDLLTGDLADRIPDDPARGLSPHADCVRYAAAHALPTDRRRTLRHAMGCTIKELDLYVSAWNNGGPWALDTLTSAWAPPPEEYQPALQHLNRALTAAGCAPSLQTHLNHVTSRSPAFHLRFGRDGRWYPYTADGTPSGPPLYRLDDFVRHAAESSGEGGLANKSQG
ncbi:SWIM zinc finger family protein (plasmid) [Streptomyces sp. NBC_00445]|uniref:SWIM zinc finger family protein n=1 Tax=Streptomyces sp. NBC_00445 TaxID=2975745 RepID=UPI002E20F100